MEQKTAIHAKDGKQDLQIIREFNLPVELLFRAYEDPELVAQWMNTKVLKPVSHGASIQIVEVGMPRVRISSASASNVSVPDVVTVPFASVTTSRPFRH